MLLSFWASAAVAFFSTTLDDFAVLLIFYAKAKQMGGGFAPYLHVMIGQVLGFSFVILLSLSGMLIGAFIPQKYVNCIGLIPLVLGFKKGYELLVDEGYLDYWYQLKCFKSNDRSTYTQLPQDLEDVQSLPHEQKRSESLRPTLPHSHSHHLSIQMPKDTDDDSFNTDFASPRARLGAAIQRGEPPEENRVTTCLSHTLASVLNPFTQEVFLYAVLCSSDNIGIYIALFATMTTAQVVEIISFFYLLLVASIFSALLLMQWSVVADLFDSIAMYLVPVLLVLLGVMILSDSVLWPF